MLVYLRNKLLGKLIMILIIMCSINYNIIYFLDKDLSMIPFVTFTSKFIGDFYLVPYTRIPPYIVGMLAGIHYVNMKKVNPNDDNTFLYKIRTSIFRRIIIYLIGLSIILFIVIFPYPEVEDIYKNIESKSESYYGHNLDSVFNGTKSTIFVVGLGIFCYPVIIG